MGRSPVEQSYHFAIIGRAISYAFGSARNKYDVGPYREYLHPKFSAKCLWPAKLAEREVEFSFVSHRRIAMILNDEDTRRHDAPVGELTMRGKTNTFLGSLPFDAAMHIQTLLALNALPYMSLIGDPLYQGRADIRYVSFDTEPPEDL